MLLIVAPTVFTVMVGYLLWTSTFPSEIKLIFTVVLISKLICQLGIIFIEKAGGKKTCVVLSVICMVIVLVYMAVFRAWYILFSCIVDFGVFAVWLHTNPFVLFENSYEE